MTSSTTPPTPPTPAAAAERTLPQLLAAQDLDRMRRYREYLDYYEGRRGAPPARGGDRVVNFNYARAIVEKGAAYLVSEHRPLVIAGGASAEERRRATTVERALLEAWEQNELARLDLETEIDTAVLGDGAFKVVWDEGEQRVVVSARTCRGCTRGGWATTCGGCGAWPPATSSPLISSPRATGANRERSRDSARPRSRSSRRGPRSGSSYGCRASWWSLAPTPMP